MYEEQKSGVSSSQPTDIHMTTILKRSIIILLFIASFFAFGQNNLDSIKKTLHFDRYTTYEYNSQGKLTKEAHFDKKKKMISYKVTEYGSLGRIKNEKNYQCRGKLFVKYENIYNSDSTIAKTTTYSDNKISDYTIYTYDRKKTILREFFDGANQLIIVESMKYNEKGRISNSTVKIKDKVLSYFEYEYIDNGSIATKFNNKSQKIGTTEHMYDNSEHEIKRIERDSSNKMTQILEWVYDDNKKQYTKFINSENKITTLAIDSYDISGRLIKTEWFEKRPDNGNLFGDICFYLIFISITCLIISYRVAISI